MVAQHLGVEVEGVGELRVLGGIGLVRAGAVLMGPGSVLVVRGFVLRMLPVLPVLISVRFAMFHSPP
ncbi:hypothetical protein ACFQ9X_15295 [Catenulispora yoronensis]